MSLLDQNNCNRLGETKEKEKIPRVKRTCTKNQDQQFDNTRRPI